MKSTLVRAHKFCWPWVFLVLSQGSHAQFQGELFTTEEERVYLDALRANFLSESHEQGFDITTAGPPPIPDTGQEAEEAVTAVEYSLGGILTRGDGSHTVWLNDRPISEATLPGNMRLVVDGAQVLLRVTAEGMVFQLKPGQTLNLPSGEILETYQRVPATIDNPDTPDSYPTDVNEDTSDQLQPSTNPIEVSPEPVSSEASAEVQTSETP